MKKIVVFLGLVVCAVLFSTSSQACETTGSAWYSRAYTVDIQKLPDDITLEYVPQPVLKATGSNVYELLAPDIHHYALSGYPKGFVPRARFSTNGVEKYNTYTKQWEKDTAVIVYEDDFSSDIPNRYDNGPGRPDSFIPQPITRSFYLFHKSKIIEVPIQINYSLAPNYDPYLQNRPDHLCGGPMIKNAFLAPILYFITMSLALINFQTTTNILKYDISQGNFNAYLFIGLWMLIIFSILFMLSTWRKRKR